MVPFSLFVNSQLRGIIRQSTGYFFQQSPTDGTQSAFGLGQSGGQSAFNVVLVKFRTETPTPIDIAKIIINKINLAIYFFMFSSNNHFF